MTEAHSHLQSVAGTRSAVLRFAADADTLCRDASLAAGRVLARIAQEIQTRRQTMEQARRELAMCQADQRNDCRAQAVALARAQESLHRAQAAQRSAQQALDAFGPSAQRFAREVAQLAREAATLTGQQQANLEDYLAGASGSGGFSGGSGGGFAGGGTVRAHGPRAGGYPSGVQMVPLDLVDNPHATVHGAGDFNDVFSPQNLEWAFDALHEVVLPAMAAGQGADYFAARDQAENRQGVRSYSDTYACFFGPDEAIRLNRQPNGRYTVGNGQHRIWVARAMGLPDVPAILQ